MNSKNEQIYYDDDREDHYFNKDSDEIDQEERFVAPQIKESETAHVNIDKDLDFQKLKNTKLFKKFLKEQEVDPKKRPEPISNDKDPKKAFLYPEKKLISSKPISSSNTFSLSDDTDIQQVKAAGISKVNKAKEQFKYNESTVSFQKNVSRDEFSSESHEENFPQFGRIKDSQGLGIVSTAGFNSCEELQGYSEIIPGLIYD